MKTAIIIFYAILCLGVAVLSFVEMFNNKKPSEIPVWKYIIGGLAAIIFGIVSPVILAAAVIFKAVAAVDDWITYLKTSKYVEEHIEQLSEENNDPTEEVEVETEAAPEQEAPAVDAQ